MAAKELSPSDLIIKSGTASKALGKSLKDNKDYDGKPRGVPPDVVGTAKISSIKLSSADKPKETWMTFNVTGVVQSPSEHKGRMVFPKFMWGVNQLQDTKTDDNGMTQADKTVQGLIRFLQGLGITQAQINTVKNEKPEKMFYTAFKVVEASTGIEFNFKTQKQKKDPQYTECRVTGPVEVDTAAAPFESADEGSSGDSPAVGEVWKYDGGEYEVTAVDAENQTVDLDNGDGVTHEGLSWFDGDNPQIEFVRASV